MAEGNICRCNLTSFLFCFSDVPAGLQNLKANEMKLQQDMTSASREITRLHSLVTDIGAELSAVQACGLLTVAHR